MIQKFKKQKNLIPVISLKGPEGIIIERSFAI